MSFLFFKISTLCTGINSRFFSALQQCVCFITYLYCGVFGGGAVFLILFIAQGLLLASSIWSDINLLPLERHSNITKLGNCHNLQLPFWSDGHSHGHGPKWRCLKSISVVKCYTGDHLAEWLSRLDIELLIFVNMHKYKLQSSSRAICYHM